MRYIFLPILSLSSFIVVSGCKTIQKKPQSSKLKYEATAVPQSEEELLSLYAKSSKFVEMMNPIISKADLSLQQASDLLISAATKDSDKRSSNQYCFSSNNKCLDLDGLPTDVSKNVKRALVNLSYITSLFEIPIVNPNMTAVQKSIYTSMVKSEKDLLPGSFDIFTKYTDLKPSGEKISLGQNHEEKLVVQWWDATIQNKCAGTMTESLQVLCRETVVGLALIEKGDVFLTKFINTSATGGSDQTSLDKYIKFNLMGHEKLGQLKKIYDFAALRISSVNEGILSPNLVQNIPSLAVVAEPAQIFERVQDYIHLLSGDGSSPGVFDNYKSSLSRLAEIERLDIDNQTEISRVLDKMNTDITAASISRLRYDVLLGRPKNGNLASKDGTGELDILLERLRLQQQHISDSSKRFVSDFTGVFGAYTSDLHRNGQEPTRLELKPGTGAYPSYTIPPNTGAISVNVHGSPKVVANGIYAEGKLPKPQQFSWLSSATKSVSNSGSKAWDKAQGNAKALGGKISDAWKDNKDGILSTITGGAFGTNGMNPFGGLGKAPGAGGIMDLAAQMAGSILQPLANIGFSALDGALPKGNFSPTALLNQLKGENIAYPPLDTHVYGQLTTLDGYIISESVGKGFSIGNSKSYSRSIGISGGISLTPVGVGATAGGNVGTSVSDSISGGVSTNAGQTLQIGFYGPSQVSNLRVGQLVAEFTCEGNKTRYAPVGVSNIIMLDISLRKCSSVRFFINDALQEATRAECQQNGTAVKCGRGDIVALEVESFVDTRDVFSKAMAIIDSPDFRKVIETSAVSTDPVGSAWRIFQSQANATGLTPAAPFQPIIEQLVVSARDQLALKQTALEIRKLESEAESITLNVDQMKRSVEIANTFIGKADKKAELIETIRSIASNQVHSELILSRFYIGRLKYWLDLYRISSTYHDPGREVDSLLLTAYRYLDDLSNTELEKTLKATQSSVLNIFENNQRDVNFVDRSFKQELLVHCLVDFAEIGLKGPALFTEAKSPTNSMGTTEPAFGLARSIFYHPLNKAETRTIDSPDNNIAKSIMTYSSNSALDEMSGYYEVVLRLDAQNFSSSYDVTMEDGKASPIEGGPLKPKLRCGGAPVNGTMKVIGLAASYLTSKIDDSYVKPPQQNIHVSRDPIMTGYLEDDLRQKTKDLFFFLDSTTLPDFYQKTWKSYPTQSVNLIQNVRLRTAPCMAADNTQTFSDINCMKTMLPGSLSGDGLKPTTAVKNTYYNTYIGGTWRVYLPDAPQWQPFLSNLNKMQLHFFLRKEESKL